MGNQRTRAWWWFQRVYRLGIITLALGLSSSVLGSSQAPFPGASHSMAISVPAGDDVSKATIAKPYSLTPDKAAKARTLGSIRTALHFGSELWEVAVLLLLLATGAASKIAHRIVGLSGNEFTRAALFSAILLALLWILALLPLAAVGHAFSLRYGISVEAWTPWLVDQVKALVVSVMLETPLLMLVYLLMRWNWSRRFYWAWMALCMIPILVVGTVLLPAVIEPIFNTFTPLSKTHPEMIQQLEKVVARTGTSIPPERMFLMKASDKSNGLNAYVTGLGPSKRIVVWDTTAERMPIDQVLFTFAHESGHYVLNHIPKGLAVGSIGIFALFGVTAWLAGRLIRRWGRRWNIPSLDALPGLAVVLFSLTLWLTATEPLQNFASRYIEHEADVYGQEAIRGIVADPQKTAVAAFNTLGAASLDDPDPSPFVEFWTYDHPSIQSRALFASHYDPWRPGETPRFFQK